MTRTPDNRCGLSTVSGPPTGASGFYPETPTSCAKAPSCADFIRRPEQLLPERRQWPGHLCPEPAMESVLKWWEQCCRPFISDLEPWAGCWPFPVGRRAYRLVAKIGHWRGNHAAAEALLPFDDDEFAAVVLPLHVSHPRVWFFGLAQPETPADPTAAPLPPLAGTQSPVDANQVSGWQDIFKDGPNDGIWAATYRLTDPAFLVAGAIPIEGDAQRIVGQAKRWWKSLRGMPISGRLPGRTISYEDFRRAVMAIRASGQRPTQERVAERLGCSVITVRRCTSGNWSSFLHTLEHSIQQK